MPPRRKKPRRVWLPDRSLRSKPKISDELKARAQVAADRLLERFRPRFVVPPPEEPKFNYCIALYTVWFRSWLYLCATYASVHPGALSPTFEVRFTRLEYAGGDRFHLAYMRHTGQWWEVFRDVPLDRAVDLIRTEKYFHP